MKRILSTFILLTLFAGIFANAPAEEEKGKTIDLTNETFIKKVFDYRDAEEWNYIGDRPAIIDFWAPWCQPCRITGPILDEMAKEFADEIYIFKVNVDEESELAQAFAIRSIPTLLFVRLDEMPQAVMGSMPKDKMKEAIEQYLLPEELEEE